MTYRSATWVKICGTTNLRDAQLSIAAGANAVGFVFAESRRRVTVERAAEIVAALSGEVECIGVFVNESPVQVAETARQVGLTGVQLHGDEPAAQMTEFRRSLGERKIIKTLAAGDLLAKNDILDEWEAARDSLDAILLDSGSAQQRGGTGVPFEWEKVQPVAARIRAQMPLIVAGGLNATNVARAIELLQPWGVDAVSGVETEPGRKDEVKLREFISAVRQHVSQ